MPYRGGLNYGVGAHAYVCGANVSESSRAAGVLRMVLRVKVCWCVCGAQKAAEKARARRVGVGKRKRGFVCDMRAYEVARGQSEVGLASLVFLYDKIIVRE